MLQEIVSVYLYPDDESQFESQYRHWEDRVMLTLKFAVRELKI